MRCPRCSSELRGFPGASIVCACGEAITIPMPSSFPRGDAAGPARPAAGPGPGGARDWRAPRPGAGPYRAAATAAPEPLETRCPFCGNACPSLVRVCPHCDVRLENVRCVRCFSLQAPGSFGCARCGHALELEPLLDATDAPCPRCRTPLEAAAAGSFGPPSAREGAAAAPDPRIHECPRCGGMFVPRDVLAEILCRAELEGPLLRHADVGPPGNVPRFVLRLDEVTYVPCPLCHSSMNRTNFGRMSGVIIDVCRKHGTWFDAGELTQAVAFAAAGGLVKSRAREAKEKKELHEQRVASRLELGAYVARSEAEDRLEAWRDFLHALLMW